MRRMSKNHPTSGKSPVVIDGNGFFRRLGQRLRPPLWFPHVPLCLATLFLGVLDLGPLLHNILTGDVTVQGLVSLSGTILADVIRGAPKVIAGVFLLIMSAGLLLRSRLAWIIVTLVTCANLVLCLVSQTRALITVAVYSAVLLASLLFAQRYFRRSSIATATLFAITSVLSLLAYAVVGTYVLGAQFSPPIKDFEAALYFAVVSMSTVGYGDIVPKTPEAHLFVVSIIILGITVFATSLSTLLVPLVSRRVQLLLRSRGKVMEHTDHYVIVSQSALARNSYKELQARGQKVTFIVETPPDHDDEHLDIIVGNASDLDVLRRANGETAKAILALGDDDSANAFVVLAAKELGGSAKTVTVVNDARNLERIKWVHPDLIIAPTILGGELLAMALSGEELEGDHLIERLLQFGS
jgi:voltage-gated potassium channel